jgi:hypothetical protein
MIFSRRSKSMTSNIRRELDSVGKQPLSIVIIISSADSSVLSPVKPRETMLRVGSLELDLIDRTARRGNRPIDLRPREFQLLKYMMERSDKVLTCENLIKDVWHFEIVPGNKPCQRAYGSVAFKGRRTGRGPDDSKCPRRRIRSQCDSSALSKFTRTAGAQAERVGSNEF